MKTQIEKKGKDTYSVTQITKLLLLIVLEHKSSNIFLRRIPEIILGTTINGGVIVNIFPGRYGAICNIRVIIIKFLNKKI